MATVPKPLHGLSPDVTMAVLPRLYFDEVVLELSRRDINIGGYTTGKDHLVLLLRDVMAQEYADLELSESQTTNDSLSYTKDETAWTACDLQKQDNSKIKSNRMPDTGTEQTVQHEMEECCRGKESIIQRPTHTDSSDQVSRNKPADINTEHNTTRHKENIAKGKDEHLAGERNTPRPSNDRIETTTKATKRTQTKSEKKYFDALQSDAKYQLQFCEARVVLERLEHQESPRFLRHNTTRSQKMQMSSPVTSSVPLREENSLNNVVPNHVNNGGICLESVSNDFLVEAEQLGYKTRLRWNTIIQTGLQGEMKVNDRKDTSTVESDLMSGRKNHESKKALPLKESDSKTFTKRKQRIGTTSSDGQLSNVGKRKQSGPVHGPSVKSKKKKVWPLEESEPKTCKKGAQKAGRTSSLRKPSNGGKSKQPSSLHGGARTTKKKVLPLKESEPKTPTKRKQNEGISSSSGEPSNDINSKHPSPMHDPSLKYRKTRIWPPQESETNSSPKRKVGTTSYSGQPSNDETNKQPGVTSEETPERQIRRRNRKKHVYVCEECGYRTRGKSTMIIHIRTHTGEKPFGCCLCSHRTTSEKNLRHHMQKRHTGLEKPYVCEYCGYTTGTKSALVKHIRIHTGEKPYACEICGYRTTCTSRMKDHIRTHTNERTHRCGQCTYRANRRDSLVRHYLTHTGDKPYHCKQCDYKSTQNCTLKRHVALMHDKRKSLQNKEKANHSDIKEEQV